MDSMSQIAQLVDRDQDVCLRILEEPGREVGFASRLLPGRSQLAGEHGQRQLGAVVEVVLQPPTLIIRHRHQTRPRLAQTPRNRLALRDDRREEHRRQRRHGNVQLRAERAARNRVDDERPRVMGRLPEREADGDGDGERAPARPEAQRGPDQGRKDDVHERPVGPQRDVGEHDHRAQHQSSFGDSRPRPGRVRAAATRRGRAGRRRARPRCRRATRCARRAAGPTSTARCRGATRGARSSR